MISFGYMCDPYQPCEKDLKLTRTCLTLLEQYGFGATVTTKSDLVLRDMDLFCSIKEKAKAVVQMTLTVADEELSKKLEPGVCNTKRRYEVLKEFQKNDIPTVVWMSPILPYLTDTKENVKALMEYCFDAGVKGIVDINPYLWGVGIRNLHGQFYRYITETFLHVNWVHLIANCLALYFVTVYLNGKVSGLVIGLLAMLFWGIWFVLPENYLIFPL